MHLGPKNTLYPYVFTFLLHVVAQFGSKVHFLSEKRQILLKAAPSAPSFGRLAPKLMPPQSEIIGGAEYGVLAGLGGCPPMPP